MSIITSDLIDSGQISGIGEFVSEISSYGEIFTAKNPAAEPKPFLIKHKNTVEVRTDGNLAKLLKEQYESVMDSRYFGRGGIEIVLSDQISVAEIADLIRLSYNLTLKQ